MNTNYKDKNGNDILVGMQLINSDGVKFKCGHTRVKNEWDAFWLLSEDKRLNLGIGASKDMITLN